MIFVINPAILLSLGDAIYLLDYAKIQLEPQRETFLVRVDPLNDDNIPEFCLEFKECSKCFFFTPFIGFDIDSTPCCNWLSWGSVKTKDDITIELLKIKQGTDLYDPLLPTRFQCKFLLKHTCKPHKNITTKRKPRKRHLKRFHKNHVTPT